MKQIVSVQVLRGLAALMVVFGHAQHHALVQSLKLDGAFERVHLLPWGAGVDIFFVISGFIMVYASENLFGRRGAPMEFLGRRVARIVPLYWIFTALYVLLATSGLAGSGKAFAGVPTILASFAFWPSHAAGHDVPLPVLELGWTLNYEMFFYLLFAAFIGLRRERAVMAVAAILAALVVLGLVAQPGAAAAFFWTRPIILEFGLGMGIALLLRGGVLLPVSVRIALLAAGFAVLIADPLGAAHQATTWTTPNDLWRVVGWGLPAALIVAAAVLGRRPRPSPFAALGLLVGDASYVLYLSHPFVIVGVRKAGQWAGLEGPATLWPMVVVSVVSSCVVAVVIHRLLERPLTRFVQGIVVRPPAPVTLAARRPDSDGAGRDGAFCGGTLSLR